jgi:hypothetical protein
MPHSGGRSVLSCIRALAFAQGCVDGLADVAKRVEIGLDDDVEGVFWDLSHQRDDFPDHRLGLIKPANLRV